MCGRSRYVEINPEPTGEMLIISSAAGPPGTASPAFENNRANITLIAPVLRCYTLLVRWKPVLYLFTRIELAVRPRL